MSATDITTATITPYRAAQIVTELLGEEGFDRTMQPQRMYGLVKSGRLTNVAGEGDKILISMTELAEWYRRYVEALKTGTVAFDNKDELKSALRGMITQQ